jgi:hypothetical protein
MDLDLNRIRQVMERMRLNLVEDLKAQHLIGSGDNVVLDAEIVRDPRTTVRVQPSPEKALLDMRLSQFFSDESCDAKGMGFSGVASRARNLARKGFAQTVGELTSKPWEDLKYVTGVGVTTKRLIRRMLQEHGLTMPGMPTE